LETEQLPEIRVDRFVQAVNALQIKPVRLEDLHYPVGVCDDDHHESSPVPWLYNAENFDALKGFINGYAWGTVNYPEVPPLRLVDVPSEARKFRVTIVELCSPLVIREGTQADEDARLKRIQARRGMRLVPR
jgi:hypothetical protein